MLNIWRRWKDYQVAAIRQSGECLRHSPWSTAITVMVLALTMTLPALLWLMTQNMQNIFSDWQRSGPLSVYVAKSTTDADIQMLLQRILKTEGVKQATLISAAEGLIALQNQTHLTDLSKYLPENPLPAVIHIIPENNIQSVDVLQNLSQLIRTYPHVEQVTVDLEWINTLYSIIKTSTNVIWSFMILLSIVVILIIGNTLRLAMDRRREEIDVLNLIGASKAYIARPHLYTGMWYGMAGACLTILCVDACVACLRSLMQPLFELDIMQHMFLLLSWRDILALMSAALFLGWISAKISVNHLIVEKSQY